MHSIEKLPDFWYNPIRKEGILMELKDLKQKMDEAHYIYDDTLATVLAVALGDVTSSLATTIFCGIIIFILAKLLLRLLRGTLEKIAGKLKIVGAVNTLLGGFVGVLGFTLLISAVLAVFAVLPVRALNNAFNDSILVGVLYKYNPVMWLIGLIL